MEDPFNVTLEELIDKYKSEPSTYICDAIGGLREIVYKMKIKKEHKIVLLSLIEESQNHANKMEDGLIHKNSLLRSEGYSKCTNCGAWGKALRDYEGSYFSCCGSPFYYGSDLSM